MSTSTKPAYEAMFLISQGEAVDLAGVVDHITDCLTRHGAELISMRKWDERRLAYEIDKQRRGVYLLAYFSCEGPDIGNIERDLTLSERVMRHMFIRADHITMDEMQALDARDELAIEAKLRAARAAEAASRDGSVPLGRKEDPAEAEQAGDEEQPKAEAGETAADEATSTEATVATEDTPSDDKPAE